MRKIFRQFKVLSRRKTIKATDWYMTGIPIAKRNGAFYRYTTHFSDAHGNQIGNIVLCIDYIVLSGWLSQCFAVS